MPLVRELELGVLGENSMGDQVRFLEANEVQRLMEAPSLKSLTGLRNRCVMGLMYEAGLRTDEVIEEKRVEVLRGKGHRARTVYFRSDELVLLLERWKHERPRGEYLLPTIRSSAGKGEKVDARGFRVTFKRYVDRAGS